MPDLVCIQEILKKYNQEHLLNFWDELTDHQKAKLLNQLSSIDFEKVDNLFKSLKTISIPQGEKLEPLDYFIKKKYQLRSVDV